MRYYTREEIWNQYYRMSCRKKCSVLYEALQNMGSYNGRSIFCCISMAMGYYNAAGLDNTYYKQ